MEPVHSSPTSATSPAELVIHTGRLKGKCRSLHQPLTLLGRAAGCDLRLNGEGVGGLHCGLVNGAAGLFLRPIDSEAPTLVNGRPAKSGPLQHGDVLTIGPFQFQVRLTAPAPAQQLADVQAKHAQEKDALRIQAAAVAAQQAALAEDEAKLQQRHAALEQQEQQLATRLEEQRSRLVEIRDQTRSAYAKLKSERAEHEAKVKETRRELDTGRHELAEKQKRVQAERDRLAKFVERLKRRWKKQWAGERTALQQREEDVARQKRRLEEEKEHLQLEREKLNQARLRFNGDAELSRRRLQADWETLRQERQQEDARLQHEHMHQHRRRLALDERETALNQVERELEADKQHWHEVRIELERETEGLENRIRNYRRKIGELEREVVLLQTQVEESRQTPADATVPAEEPSADTAAETAAATEENAAEVKEDAAAETTGAAAALAPLPTPGPPVAPVVPAVEEPAASVSPAEQAEALAMQERLAQLEKLSGELADQRLHLLEQCHRLVAAQQHWQQQRDSAAVELEEVGKKLHGRELEIQQREHALQSAEYRQQQLHLQAQLAQRHLDGWQARMTARESAWTSERDRLAVHVQDKDKLAEQRLTAIGQLHERWQRRRRREVQGLQAERTAIAKLRRDYGTLRQTLLQRGAALERERRLLAERELALEQLQQEAIGKSPHPASAGRRLEQLRRRWAGMSAAAQKAVDEQRQTLAKEAAELSDYHVRLKKQSDKVTAQEAELGRQVAAWEHARLVAQDEMNRMHSTLQVSQAQRDRFEKQVHELNDEVERMARLLLDEPEPIILAAGRAAA